MTVDFDYIKIECFELVGDGIRRTYVFNLTVNLKSVVVYDYNKVVKFSVTCEHCSFPDLAFLDFTVAAKSVYSVILV